jgi:RNA polymerase sigma-70 factor (ECF subfamily)
VDEDAARADRLAAHFEQHRPHLRRVATGLLGSADEADDAVQETWLRLQRTGADGIDNLAGWLTTVVGRVCLDTLRRRAVRQEQPLDVLTSDPPGSPEPEVEAVLAESLGLALVLLLDVLTPPERLALVLHDVFAVPFDQVAAVLDRSTPAARQLTSRARRRLHAAAPVSAVATTDRRRHRAVEAFLRAARDGDLQALLSVLDPDVVLRTDGAVEELSGPGQVRGDAAVASALLGRARSARLALVDGAVGAVFTPAGRLRGALELVVAGDRVLSVDVLSDEAVLEALEVVLLDAAPT